MKTFELSYPQKNLWRLLTLSRSPYTVLLKPNPNRSPTSFFATIFPLGTPNTFIHLPGEHWDNYRVIKNQMT